MIRREKKIIKGKIWLGGFGENTTVANVKVDGNRNIDVVVNVFMRRMIRVYIKFEK